MKPTVENFQVISSTSTELEVELTPTIRLKCLRHSNRRTGSSVKALAMTLKDNTYHKQIGNSTNAYNEEDEE